MNRLALALSLAALTACGPGEAFRKKEAEAAKYQSDLKTEQERSAELQTKLDASQTDLKKTQDDLGKTQADLEASQGRVQELEASQQQLEVAKADLERKSAEYEKLASSLKSEIDSGRVEITELKGKMTVKMKDKILFSSGSAKIGKDGKKALQAVADALKGVEGKAIRVEGHTDNVPTTGTAFASNWQLSTARALAVVQFFQSAGIDPDKLVAAGYGEYQPVASNDSAEGRSQNRRIEIVLAPGATGK